jgi:predicted nucleic acid-binding protein
VGRLSQTRRLAAILAADAAGYSRLMGAGEEGRSNASKALRRRAELPITTDKETTTRAWRQILALARAEGLTTYDATYLELAIRRGLPLMTKDAALIAGAGRSGVAIAA